MSLKSKSFTIALLVALFIGIGSIASKCSAQARECVVATYSAEVGVREATGHNDGEPEKYLKSTGLGKGFAWCAAFVNWTLKKCGGTYNSSAWSPDWFPPHRVLDVTKDTPMPGDVFGIYFPAKGRIAHVGFIHVWGVDRCVTVEGNTVGNAKNSEQDRNGDGVYKKIRLTSQISKVSRWID